MRGYIGPLLSNSVVWATLLDAPVAALACNQSGQLLLANQAMMDLLGRPLEQLLGQKWLPLLCSTPAVLKEVLSSSGTVRHRKQVGDGAGDLSVEVTCSAVRLPDNSGGVIALAAANPQVRATADRSFGERGYRELVEDAADVMTRFDAESGRLLYVNRAVERFTGVTPEEIVSDGALWSRLVVRDYRAQWDAAFAQVRRGDARTFDLGLRHRDGRISIVHQSLSPVRDTKGRPRFVEGSARDVTSVRQIEALKARNEERASLDRLKSELIANVSHELRTPLVSIKGYNDLLLREALGPVTARQRRGLEIASANTERLIELIETLLDFQRREEGRLELRSLPLDLRQPIEEAVKASSERIASRNLTLTVDLGQEPLPVLGDRMRLAQVFRAILSNAAKFSDAAGGEVRISAEKGDDWVGVSVTDRGIGIPKESHARIFDRFYQVDASSTRRFGGAGLGLALAKELVTLHGGTIEVASAEGQGATFTVRMPRPARERKATPVGAALHPVILVGAAEGAFGEIKDALERSELKPLVLYAPNEAELLARARRHRPDLVLVALESGTEQAVARLKEHPDTHTLPVVAMAADGLPIVHADLVVEGGGPEQLRAGVERLLAHRPTQAHPRRVVIVEDELEILDFTRFVLEREGYQVVCVSEGGQALAAIDERCDLVILDIALEDTDGLEVCKQLRAAPRTREVPILVMTAMSGDEVRELSIKAGADAYLMKPFGLDEFLRQVNLHVRGSADPAGRESA